MLLIQSILRTLNVEVEEYEGYMPESPFLEKEDMHSTLFASKPLKTPPIFFN